MKSLIIACGRMVTAVDSNSDETHLEKLPRHINSRLSRFKGACRCIFWWAIAVCFGLLIAQLH